MKRVSIKVKLLDYTPEPERVVAMAARLCYSASGAEELAERLDEAAVRKMVRKMVKIGHGSTLEHASFTFGVEGVSRVLTHQLVRHRIASYDQQSQRYVAAHGFAYITPPSIAAQPEAKARYDKLIADIRARSEKSPSVCKYSLALMKISAAGMITSARSSRRLKEISRSSMLRGCIML